MKNWMIGTSLAFAGIASAATPPQLPTAAFDIQWDASRSDAMKQMKQYGWVLEKTKVFPGCGQELTYGGALAGNRGKASLNFNAKNQTVEIRVWFPNQDGKQLFDSFISGLKIKYKTFVYTENSSYSRTWWKYLRSDSSYRVYANATEFENEPMATLFLSYSSPGSGFLDECRRTIPGL